MKGRVDEKISKEMDGVNSILNSSGAESKSMLQESSMLGDKVVTHNKYKHLKLRFAHSMRQLNEKKEKIKELEKLISSLRNENENLKSSRWK